MAFDIQTISNLMSESGWEVQELYYADSLGNKADIITGQNLVCVAK